MNLKKVSDGLHKLNTSQIIALGFAGVIFVGGLILWMPFCSAPGQAVTFPDAGFTAATSVCETGLSTVVMAVQWSPIGKAVILCLIQIGGIGLGFSGLGLLVQLLLAAFQAASLSAAILPGVLSLVFLEMISYGNGQRRRLKRAEKYLELCGT